MHRISILRSLIIVFWALAMASCGSVLKPYPLQINPVIAVVDQEAPEFEKTVKQQIGKKIHQKDQILYNMELGRLYQLRGEFEKSITHFRQAIAAIKVKDTEAKVTAKKGAGQASAVLTNDNAVAYRGYGYERVMLHHFQAMNFLATHHLEEAMVEARRANLEQKIALERHARELNKLQNDKEKTLSEKGPHARKNASELEQSLHKGLAGKLKAMDALTTKVKNSFQNSYTFYITALLYQSRGRLDQAYIDYRRALELSNENNFLLRDVLTLAEKLGRDEDYRHYARRLTGQPVPIATSPDRGEVIFLFENDRLPERKQVKITLPNPKLNLSSVAFPVYPKRLSSPSRLHIQSDKLSGETQVLTDLRILAVKNLRERVPAMTTRQIIRLAVKEAGAQEAEKEWGILGKLGMNILNTWTEKADLRSWMSLPDQVELFRCSMPSGTHTFALTHPAMQSHSLVLDVTPGSLTLVMLTRVGSKLFIKTHLLNGPEATERNGLEVSGS